MSTILALGMMIAPAAAMAQAASKQGTAPQTPVATARDAAATWAGFAASQQLFGPAGVTPTAPGSVTGPGGAAIAPADVTGRMTPPTKPGDAEDGILRSAAPSVGIGTEGHGAIVSGATLR